MGKAIADRCICGLRI